MVNWIVKLKFQARFASRFSKRFDASMVFAMSPIKLDTLDTVGDRFLRKRFADRSSGLAVSARLYAVAQALVFRAGTDKRLATEIVNQLATKVGQAAIDAQSGMIGGATQFVANVKSTPLTIFIKFLVLIHNSNP